MKEKNKKPIALSFENLNLAARVVLRISSETTDAKKREALWTVASILVLKSGEEIKKEIEKI